MSVLISRWHHIPGKHCGSTALRDVMHFYGIKISEEMCFGIGSGLGFYYFKNPEGSPSRAIMVRSAGMENNFFRHIEHSFRWHVGESNSLNKVKTFIREGIPVLLQTDIYYLKYYNSKTHFAGHVITVWGYDDEEGVIFVSDTGWEGLQKVPYEDLEKAWVHPHPPFYIDHNWAEVTKPPSVNLERAVVNSAVTQATELLSPVFGSSAMERLRVFASSLPEWAEVPDWKWCARFAYQVIERRGTGGGAFRLMYAKFLEEAHEMFPHLFTTEHVQRMYTIAERWTKLAALLKEISEKETPGDGFKKCAVIAEEIADMEHTFFENILSILKG